MPRLRGSGRSTVEELAAVNTSALKRCGSLASGSFRIVTWRSFRIAIAAGDISLGVEHPGIGRRRVGLDWTACHFGGRRSWFLCPDCGRRVGVLYIGRQFACRRCCGLAYASQRENDDYPLLSEMQVIRRRLGGTANVLAPFPQRPRRMHHRTFWNQWREYQDLADRHFRAMLDTARDTPYSNSSKQNHWIGELPCPS